MKQLYKHLIVISPNKNDDKRAAGASMSIIFLTKLLFKLKLELIILPKASENHQQKKKKTPSLQEE